MFGGFLMEEFALGPSPFRQAASAPKVIVTGGKGPYDNIRNALAKIDLSPAKGKRVLLKPNAGRIAVPGAAITTHPQALAAVIDAFAEAGADVSIGESPISGVKTMEAFETTGIAEVAKERNIPLIDMDERKAVKIKIPNGRAINSLQLCPEIMEFDLIVSVPVIKMHMHTGVTLAVKNMKGCLWRRSKVLLHMLPPVEGVNEKPINVAIADMAGILRPHLSVIDGYLAMEGLGPSAGKAREMNVALVSADPFAADAVACQLMGLRAEDVPHLAISGSRGFGEILIPNINIEPKDWRKWITPLDNPPLNLSIVFPEVNILDKNSCSACQSTLLLFMKRYGKKLFDYFPAGEKINVAIGKGHESVPRGTLCIGNCMSKHKDSGIYVKGCPPVGSEILCAISGKPSIDVMDGHSETPVPEEKKD